jgi:hypothetical protein
MRNRRRYGRAVTTVRTSWENPETGDETDITVECSITPGEPARGPSYHSAGEPGCGPEIEILSALDDDGHDWTEEIEGDKDWMSEIEDKAVECASDDGDDDRAYDEERDRRAERGM